MAQEARRSAPTRWRFATRALAPAAAMSGLAIFASTAYACTMIMGPLTITPSSAPAGTVVATTVTGLKPYPAQYDLFFGGECMTFTGKLLKTITTNTSGGWTDVHVRIPSKAKPGTYSLCGVEAYPVAGQTATSHNTFTVV